MLIEYDNDGRILHVIGDPVNPAVRDHYLSQGGNILDLPPVTPEPTVIPADPPFDDEGKPNPPTIIEHDAIESFADGWNDYILDGQVTPRPSIAVPAELAMMVGESRTLEGLPENCRILVDGAEMHIDGTSLTLTADMPASYIIEFDHWPYLPATLEVTINAA